MALPSRQCGRTGRDARSGSLNGTEGGGEREQCSRLSAGRGWYASSTCSNSASVSALGCVCGFAGHIDPKFRTHRSGCSVLADSAVYKAPKSVNVLRRHRACGIRAYSRESRLLADARQAREFGGSPPTRVSLTVNTMRDGRSDTLDGPSGKSAAQVATAAMVPIRKETRSAGPGTRDSGMPRS